MRIRRADSEDVPGIVGIHIAAWDAAKDGLDLATRRTPADRTDLWTRFLAEGRGELWVADIEGTVAGFCALGPSRDDDRAGQCEVFTLYVDPGMWDCGIGSALLARVPADETVSLWVAEANVRARRFYERRGFVADGAREEGHHVPVIRVARDRASPA